MGGVRLRLPPEDGPSVERPLPLQVVDPVSDDVIGGRGALRLVLAVVVAKVRRHRDARPHETETEPPP